MKKGPDTLILGWGNPGRGDDGLGPALIGAVNRSDLPGVRAESAYQLQVEDAAEVAGCDRVVFVDADRTGAEPFSIERLRPYDGRMTFSTHSISPATVLALVRDLFQVEPEAWILGIRGYEFDEFREQLSDEARSNMEEAVKYLESAIRAGGLFETRSRQVTKQIAIDPVGELWQTNNP